MPTNYSNGVSSFGIPLVPNIPLTTGTFFYVSSVVGSDGNSGRDKSHALATVQAAINKCTAAKADVIILMPGHAETVTATNIALNVSGVRIYGLGTGLLRPTFTYGAAAATITVSVANTGWDNCHFIANFVNVLAAFTVTTGKDCAITNNSFVDVDSTHNFLSIVAATGAANTADGLIFNNNYVQGLAVTDGPVVAFTGASARVQISYNVVDKNAATNDAGHLVTLAAVATVGIRVVGNCLSMAALASQSTGTLGTGSSTASSGIVADNYVNQIDTTTALLWTAGSKISFLQNFVSGAADACGTIFPAVDDPA